MNAPITIDTPRTRISALATDHTALLLDYRLRNRDHLAPSEPARGAEYYTEQAVASRIAQVEAEAEAGSALHLAALDRASGQLVALCSFTNIVRGPFQACHLGFSVDHAHEGSGLMAEVAGAGINYVFDQLRLHRIMAAHMPRNERSAGLLARLGFEREGYARSYLRINGQWEDMVLLSLVDDRPGA
ncbi:ribosomal protein S5-alanine N-acetyltransferase [Massilia terrae]|uniref:GNAT family N-acetyltransferase n=1 Tax=Massilia terrae TaxID=1811224 RepID=A0ABT2D5I4_9BURK|nr:GNAT family N-acetyltransferase [Massilia terrae]MCS0661026.1 GNAT family N-acetyltransferase [Massilia terrae]